MNSHITNLYPKPNVEVTEMEMLTVPNNAVKTFTTTYNARTKYITLDVQDNDVYVVYTSGDTPSNATGHILYAGNSYTWSRNTAQAAKFIAVGGTAVIAASEFTE